MAKKDKLEKTRDGEYSLVTELDLDYLKNKPWVELTAGQKDYFLQLACEEAGLLVNGKVKL